MKAKKHDIASATPGEILMKRCHKNYYTDCHNSIITVVQGICPDIVPEMRYGPEEANVQAAVRAMQLDSKTPF